MLKFHFPHVEGLERSDMKDDFVYIPAAKTDVGKRIREEWERLGQLPPDQDPKVLENRKKAWDYGKE
jgi:hypothetical protein